MPMTASSCILFMIILGIKKCQLALRLKKNKLYVSKLPRAFVFRCVFDSAKSKLLIFFFLLAQFFSSFL